MLLSLSAVQIPTLPTRIIGAVTAQQGLELRRNGPCVKFGVRIFSVSAK